MVHKGDLPKFNPEIYTKIALTDLVIYSINYSQGPKDKVSSEDIVSASFLLFPKRFALRKYSHWPDSAMIHRRWSDCKRKGYLRGNATDGFQITAKGIRRAEKIGKSLGTAMKPVRIAPRPKTVRPTVVVQTIRPDLKRHAGKYIRSIEMSDAYKHYKKQMPLNEFDFRSLLLCTMETPPKTLARNIEQFKEYVKVHDRKDLLSFLEFCENKFSYMLSYTTKPIGKKAKK